MSYLSNALVACETLQGRLEDYWQTTDAMGADENMPLAEFLANPANRRNIQTAILPGQGKKKVVRAYDPATGELRWKERQGTPKKVARFNRNSAGRIAGVKAYTGTDKKTPRGIVIRVRGMASKAQYAHHAHRIIWEMVNGPIRASRASHHLGNGQRPNTRRIRY